MDLKQVEYLLDKYWEGSSTLEEEKLIQDFFAKGELPGHLEVYAELFTANEYAIHPELGKAFDEKLLNEISKDQHSSIWNVFKMAAIGLILIITSISVFQVDSKQQQLAEDTFNTPEAALAETKKVFAMISKGMNKGEQPLILLSKWDESNEKIKNKKAQ